MPHRYYYLLTCPIASNITESYSQIRLKFLVILRFDLSDSCYVVGQKKCKIRSRNFFTDPANFRQIFDKKLQIVNR